jgi:hypothetical protein
LCHRAVTDHVGKNDGGELAFFGGHGGFCLVTLAAKNNVQCRGRLRTNRFHPGRCRSCAGGRDVAGLIRTSDGRRL